MGERWQAEFPYELVFLVNTKVLPSAVLQSLTMWASAWLVGLWAHMAQCNVCVLHFRQSVMAASLWGGFVPLGRQK